MPSFSSLNVLSLIVALSASGATAHPRFRGQLISRASDLLPEYDYVVVGAGASGLTVANRLSEHPNVNVLVIEAGDFDQDEAFIEIPGLAGGAIGTKYDWNISYAADEGLGGRVVPVPLGRVVGGSTKLNRMVFDRGSRSDYDGWEALGNEGWNFATLLPYFKKNERFTPPTPEIVAEYNIKYDLNYHGNNGYVQSTFSPFFWPTTKNAVQATQALGIPINDQATGNAIGGYFCPKNQDPKNVSRSSAEEAYYASAARRSNFHLITGHQALRIVTDSSNGTIKATGVEFATSVNATRQSVKVKQEALLAAGTLHTPQLLQVSGIGDTAHLDTIGVQAVVDLPAVGHNLHDHLSVFILNTINTTLLTQGTLTANATFAAAARQEYDTERKGPLTSPTGDFLLFLPVSTYTNATQNLLAEVLASSPSVSLPADVPDSVAQGYDAQYTLLNEKLVANDSAFMEIIWADGGMVLGLQHPYSRGSVKASTSSIFDAPIADAGFLRNPIDVALMREGVRFARTFARAPGIVELSPFEVLPGANVTSDADIDTFIRGSATTLYHPAGSCKMGAKDEGGVVDGELKVYGVEGLRVVDASVIPMLPASHTMTTVYAIAEKAADVIRASAAYKASCRG